VGEGGADWGGDGGHDVGGMGDCPGGAMNRMKLPLQDETTSRAKLRIAAAEVFLTDPQFAVNLAGVTTAKFVQVARQVYRAEGFNFSDKDLRVIHNRVRSLVIQRRLGETPAA
jgi:hypothetical protein